MADGKFSKYIPPPPPLPKEVGFIEKYINGVGQGLPHYVCKIPEGLADPKNPPAVNEMVTWDEGQGRTASNVARVTVTLGILNFQAARNPDGSDHLWWETQNAATANIIPGNINVSDKLPDGEITITNPTATTYTLTVYDSASNSNSASDSV